MLEISVISYKRTNLRVRRPVSLKYLRFPDQNIKGNIDSLNDTGYLTKFYMGSHCPMNEPLPMFIPFLTAKVSSFVYFPLKNDVP